MKMAWCWKSITMRWSRRLSIPSRPAAPRLPAVRVGAAMSRIRRAPTSSVPISAVGVRSTPPVLLSMTGSPGPRPSCRASSLETTVRSAPVSTTKAKGPCPLTRTGTVMRSAVSLETTRRSGPGGGCGMRLALAKTTSPGPKPVSAKLHAATAHAETIRVVDR